MDWRRLVTDDANETDLLRSYVVRVTDATFGYMAEHAAAESGVPTAEGRERMWTLFERGALRLVGPVTDDDRIGVEPCNNNEWHEQAKKNGPLVEWRRQIAAAGDTDLAVAEAAPGLTPSSRKRQPMSDTEQKTGTKVVG